jgi:taurine dioxygenase
MFPRISRLHPAFVGEVPPLDVRTLTSAARNDLAGALLHHLLLIFRGQSLSFDDQVAFTGIFGEVDDRLLASDRPFRHADDQRIQVVTNDRSTPTPLTATLFWHVDQSFRPSPAPVIVLSAACVPASGGTTVFADMRSAYEALPPDRLAALDSLTCRHRFGAGLGIADLMSPEGGALHPLVRTHPTTKRRSLYLNPLCTDSVEGLPPREGTELLADLCAHATKPEFVYEHQWRSGDVLAWDNHSLMHRLADIPASPRVLYRTHTRGSR